MSRALITLAGPASRGHAQRLIERAPHGTRVELKGPRRSNDQNALMWALLTDVARQKEHAGRKYTVDQWKAIFMHACGREVQFLPSLDGATFIPWGNSSSDLSKAEMTDLLEFILAWGTENGVQFSDRPTARSAA
jgi:hypothetical protein